MMAKRGKLIVLAGPSGVGKGTIGEALMRRYPEIEFSVSVTTRPPRPYEVHGKHYFFISREEFEDLIRRNELVEWEEVFARNGHLYGTLRSYVDQALHEGRVLLLDIDIKGGLNVKRTYPEDTVAIFIRPPSREELERRLRRRGTDSEEQIALRLARMPEELRLGEQFDFQVVNDKLEKALEEVFEIIEKHVFKAKQEEAIDVSQHYSLPET